MKDHFFAFTAVKKPVEKAVVMRHDKKHVHAFACCK
jgi:hypothetical protein